MYDINELFQTVTPYIYQSIIYYYKKHNKKYLASRFLRQKNKIPR